MTSETGVEIEVSRLPHSLFLFPPKITVDQSTREGIWGANFVALEPGKHTVSVAFMPLFVPAKVQSSIEVVVEAGKKSRLRHDVSFWGFKGRFKAL